MLWSKRKCLLQLGAVSLYTIYGDGTGTWKHYRNHTLGNESTFLSAVELKVQLVLNPEFYTHMWPSQLKNMTTMSTQKVNGNRISLTHHLRSSHKGVSDGMLQRGNLFPWETQQTRFLTKTPTNELQRREQLVTAVPQAALSKTVRPKLGSRIPSRTRFSLQTDLQKYSTADAPSSWEISGSFAGVKLSWTPWLQRLHEGRCDTNRLTHTGTNFKYSSSLSRVEKHL